MITTIGVDVAHMGLDRSAAVIRRDNCVLAIESWAKETIPQSADRVERLAKRYRADKIIVDADGLGCGVVDILRDRDLPVFAFHGQAKTERKDASGELGFSNARSAAYWNLRVLLDPHSDPPLLIPKNDTLLGDIVAPRWSVQNQRIVIESKDNLKKRLGRSPDLGDALAYAFYEAETSSFEEAYRVLTPSDIEAAARQGQRPVARTEEEQIDGLMWGGMTNNTDLSSLF